MMLTEVRFGASKHNQIIFKGNYGGDTWITHYKHAANKIGDWFLKVSYDPQYKFCRDKRWKEFQAICEEEDE